jgi:phage/plasmid primase-like uncharacterized protein
VIPSEAIRTAMNANICATAVRLGIHLKMDKANMMVGKCPACAGDETFRVNVRKETWLCVACARSGIAIDLVRHASGRSFGQAVAFLASDAT